MVASVKVRPFRIPRNIVLPGLVVGVTEAVSDDACLDGADGAWRYGLDGSPRIFINQGMKLTRKRYILLHELHHVIVDYLHMCMQDHPNLVKP